jgi:hypothetical protein
LKLEYEELLSNVAFNFNLRRYIKGFTHPVREYFLEDVFEMTGYLIGKASKWAKKKLPGGGQTKVGRCRLTPG